MKMNQELEELQTFTIERFQENFDTLMNRVENGESFVITSKHGNVVIVPCNEVVRVYEETDFDFDEIVKIHTDHEEAS